VDLEGLDLPGPDAQAESGAVRLFVQSARRARARFALTEANGPEVARICRLVDGLPLAIELAAALVRTRDCAAIAREIERDLDFLASPLRDVPDRHRSMRAVFEHSWALLGDPEREALRRLSVFRGGFEAEAAREVAGVEPRLLAALVDKSLLHRAGAARYELHELLRQFAEELLRLEPEEHEATLARHVAYYQALAGAAALQPYRLSPGAWTDRLEQEYDKPAAGARAGAARRARARPSPAEHAPLRRPRLPHPDRVERGDRRAAGGGVRLCGRPREGPRVDPGTPASSRPATPPPGRSAWARPSGGLSGSSAGGSSPRPS
jgi:predicted ATPase